MKEAVWIAAGVLVLCALVSFFWYQNNGLSVTRYRLKGMRVTRPMKIVHLSDLHSKRFGRDNEKLFALVADCSPDLIAITGDLIDDSDRDFCRTVRIVGRLCGWRRWSASPATMSTVPGTTFLFWRPFARKGRCCCKTSRYP